MFHFLKRNCNKNAFCISGEKTMQTMCLPFYVFEKTKWIWKNIFAFVEKEENCKNIILQFFEKNKVGKIICSFFIA